MCAASVVKTPSTAVLGGGKLLKAALVVVAQDVQGSLLKRIERLEFPINPESVTVLDRASPVRAKTTGSGPPEKQGAAKEPRQIKFKAVFDTYEERKDVRKEYVHKLHQLARPQKELHVTPTLIFTWGNLTSDTESQFPCDLEQFDVTYTMFLPDGTPVRCNVDIVLKEVTSPDDEAKKNESPDHAKLHVVRRGDTLHDIAYREYDDPGEWRRIADANSIDDPMDLEPGTRLLVPPILK